MRVNTPINEAERLLQEKYIGKRVSIRTDTQFDKNVKIVGKCDFIGYNVLLNKKQITIDRMPIFVKQSYDELQLQLI